MFTYVNDVRSQIDFILINKKWINCVVNCEHFNFFSTVSSDHWIVTVTIQLSLRDNKPQPAKKKPNMTGLHCATVTLPTSSSFLQTISMLFRMKALKTANSAYKNIEQACAQVADEMIPAVAKPS